MQILGPVSKETINYAGGTRIIFLENLEHYLTLLGKRVLSALFRPVVNSWGPHDHRNRRGPDSLKQRVNDCFASIAKVIDLLYSNLYRDNEACLSGFAVCVVFRLFC